MINTKVWKTKEISKNSIENIIKSSGVSKLMATTLASRGITGPEAIDNFLRPKLSNLYTPMKLKGMQKSVERIIDVINEKGKILIYGDYDVDGVTSTSLLYNFLKSINANADYFIPDRLEEGYGLNMNAVEDICNSKPSLIITVDCGVSGVQEVEYINKHGIDIIITDHHECPEKLPEAYAIINPKQRDCEYPFKQLAGVGVAFKLVQALSQRIYGNDNAALRYLDLVCLGTIADIVPLVDENRILAKYGLETIASTENIGLNALCRESGLKEIDSWNIGYVLTPRINAAGRLGAAERAVELFVTDDLKRAESIAKELVQENKKRQDIEAELTEEIIQLIDGNNLNNENILIISGENWHHGVIGIAASRITEKYNKPCILISFEDEIGRGSGRSVEGINLFEVLQKSAHLLEKYGGHEKAGGLTIKRDNISEFKKLVQQITNENIEKLSLEKTINVDAVISSSFIDFRALNELKQMEPFGMENPAPLFIIEKLEVFNIKAIGENKHLKFVFNSEGSMLDGIGFRMGELQNELEVGSVVDAVCSPEINKFNGRVTIQLNIKDIRKSSIQSFESKFFNTFELANSVNEIGQVINKLETHYEIKDMNAIHNLIASGRKNLFIINTLEAGRQIIDELARLYGQNTQKYSIHFNELNTNNLNNNLFLINPFLENINFADYDNVILCDSFFIIDNYVTINNRCKNCKIVVLFGNKDLEYNLQVLNDIKPDRTNLEAIYRFLRNSIQELRMGVDEALLTDKVEQVSKLKINPYIFRKSLDIFHELKLIDRKKEHGLIKIELPLYSEKVNLNDSKYFSEFSQYRSDFEQVEKFLSQSLFY